MSVRLLKLVIIAAMLLMFTSCGKIDKSKKEVVRPIKIHQVSRGGLGHFSFPGVVDAGKKVLMSFRVNGRIMELPVMEGEQVKEGQLIARLDPKDFQLMVDQAKAQFIKAQADYDRYQTLYEKDAVPIADLDFRRAQRDVAKTKLNEAEKNLAYTFLRAPFPGVIGNRYVENFMDVRANESIVDLNNVKDVEIIINVPESLIRGLREGIKTEAFAKFENVPGVKFPLSRKELSNRADQVTQTFRVTLLMPQPKDFTLLPGMTCEVVVNVEYDDPKVHDYITSVPAISVLTNADGSNFVWVIDKKSMTVSKRGVTIGMLQGSENITITKGLKGGEIIAVAGITKLNEGMKVRFWEEQEEEN